ncbi:MAG: short-chain dehydrogenase, partial [Rhodobacterales bacterium]
MAVLSGKTVVVTGASKGIGAAITAAMVQGGARVIA